jgi:hypothetical protein
LQPKPEPRKAALFNGHQEVHGGPEPFFVICKVRISSFREDQVTGISVKPKGLLPETRLQRLPYVIDKFAWRSHLKHRIRMSVWGGGSDYFVVGVEDWNNDLARHYRACGRNGAHEQQHHCRYLDFHASNCSSAKRRSVCEPILTSRRDLVEVPRPPKLPRYDVSQKFQTAADNV